MSLNPEGEKKKGPSRRDFLKLAGGLAAAATVSTAADAQGMLDQPDTSKEKFPLQAGTFKLEDGAAPLTISNEAAALLGALSSRTKGGTMEATFTFNLPRTPGSMPADISFAWRDRTQGRDRDWDFFNRPYPIYKTEINPLFNKLQTVIAAASSAYREILLIVEKDTLYFCKVPLQGGVRQAEVVRIHTTDQQLQAPRGGLRQSSKFETLTANEHGAERDEVLRSRQLRTEYPRQN